MVGTLISNLFPAGGSAFGLQGIWSQMTFYHKGIFRKGILLRVFSKRAFSERAFYYWALLTFQNCSLVGCFLFETTKNARMSLRLVFIYLRTNKTARSKSFKRGHIQTYLLKFIYRLSTVVVWYRPRQMGLSSPILDQTWRADMG